MKYRPLANNQILLIFLLQFIITWSYFPANKLAINHRIITTVRLTSDVENSDQFWKLKSDILANEVSLQKLEQLEKEYNQYLIGKKITTSVKEKRIKIINQIISLTRKNPLFR